MNSRTAEDCLSEHAQFYNRLVACIAGHDAAGTDRHGDPEWRFLACAESAWTSQYWRVTRELPALHVQGQKMGIVA